MTELQNKFERYGVSIENVFLFDYFLTRPISDCTTLNDTLDVMGEAEIREIFGDRLARRILAEDPDLAFYFQEAGGVFISGECACPDVIEFYPGTEKPKSWLTGLWRRIIYSYAPTLDDALQQLVTRAVKVHDGVVAKAISTRKVKMKEDSNEQY